MDENTDGINITPGEEPTLTFPEAGPIPPPDMPPNYHRHHLPDMADILDERVPAGELGSYDTVMSFIRAQGAFIRAQIYFLEHGRTELDDKIYIQHLTGFATAQAAFIKAQQDFLKMYGAM